MSSAAQVVSGLPFTSPNLLAPMEGVTEPVFRELVLARNPPNSLGGTFTEFLRVTREPIRRTRILEHLGPPASSRAPGPEASSAPVGLQLLGAETGPMAETARRAEELGVVLVDLNFGCPAKGALRGRAGSALLDRPADIEALLRACVDAVDRTLITAKIRAGGEDDSALEDIARAAEAGGAKLLSVHCRTREEGYRGPGDWERIARSVAAVSIPVAGNGGVESHADLARMRGATGCTFSMVGRAALADPWIFSGREVERAEAARFLLDYAEGLRSRAGARDHRVAGRLKQLLRVWKAGDLVGATRDSWMRETGAEGILQRLIAEIGRAGRDIP